MTNLRRSESGFTGSIRPGTELKPRIVRRVIPPPASPPPSGADLLRTLVVIAAMAGAVIAALSLIRPGSLNLAPQDRSTVTVMVIMLQSAVALFSVYLGVQPRYGTRSEMLGFRPVSGRWIGVAVFLAFAAGQGLGYATDALDGIFYHGHPAQSTESLILSGAGVSQLVWMFIAAGIFGPVSEEILFRGLLFGWMRTRMHWTLAALLSSIAFGLVHLDLQHIVFTTGLGMILAATYHLSKSLWTSIITHAVNNCFAVVVVSLCSGANC